MDNCGKVFYGTDRLSGAVVEIVECRKCDPNWNASQVESMQKDNLYVRIGKASEVRLWQYRPIRCNTGRAA